jgi:Ca-activated chloride channel family protein
MRFIWPGALWALLLLPVLVAFYLWILRRRRRVAVTFASVAIVRQALGRSQRWRRHVPAALLLVAVAASIIAAARPAARVTLPADYMTLVLAIDVSRSMLANDVEPSRIEAAQAAARAFIQDLPSNVRAGIVTFAGTAQVVQNVTDRKEDLLAAIDRFQLQRATATGSGLLMALATLMPDAGIDVEQAVYGRGFGRSGEAPPVPAPAAEIRRAAPPGRSAAPPVAPGSYSGGAIVLLSDGRRTHGPDPIAAARRAADLGVRVYTVGFGTPNGTIPGYDGWSFYVRVDEETLKAVARVTEAEYFHAATAEDLRKVYEGLSSRFALERRDTEVSAIFAAVSAVLLILSAMLSQLWFRRLA